MTTQAKKKTTLNLDPRTARLANALKADLNLDLTGVIRTCIAEIAKQRLGVLKFQELVEEPATPVAKVRAAKAKEKL